MKILIVNGPNLNLIEKRDFHLYGSYTLNEINKLIEDEFPDIFFTFFQSNIEGELINKIQIASSSFDGLIINPGGFSHYSVAISDALEICNIPKIEVHLSNLANREEFRKTSLTASKCNGYISGFNYLSYIGAVYIIKKLILVQND